MRTNGRNLIRVLLSWLILAAVATVLPVHAQQKDYSKGFKKLYDLGLPDVSKATYVKLDMRNGGGIPDLSELLGDGKVRLSGNAWLLEEKAGKGRFVVANCKIMEVYDQKMLDQEQKGKMKVAPQGDRDVRSAWQVEMSALQQKPGGMWKNADLKGDVEKVMKAIGEAQKKTSSEDYESGVQGAAGYAFLAAIHFHGHGYTNEANAIVDFLFAACKDQRKVVQSGLNQLAETQYALTCGRFFGGGTWEKFDADLTGLIGRFTPDWKKGELIKKIQKQVAERAQQTRPPTLPAEGLTETDQAIAVEIADTTNTALLVDWDSLGSTLWIIPSSAPQFQPRSAPREGDQGVLIRVLRKGIKSVPLLLAMLKDNCLTRFDTHGSAGGSDDFSGDDSFSEWDGSGDPEQIGQLFDSLRRPLSRGEIAAMLLSPLPTSGKEEPGRQSPSAIDREELYDACKKWYEKNKDKTEVELARAYMKEGTPTQRGIALQSILRIGSDADMKELEKSMLSSKKPMEEWSTVHLYLQKQGEKAKDFVEQYIASLKQWAAYNKQSQFFRSDANSKEAIDGMVALLRQYVSTESAKEIVERVLSGTNRLEHSRTALNIKLAKEEPQDALYLVLDGATRARDTKLAMTFLSLAGQVPYLKTLGQWEAGTEPPETPARIELDIKFHAELWKKLIADQRTAPSDDPFGFAAPATVADIAVSLVEGLYGKGRDENVTPHMQMWPDWTMAACIGAPPWDSSRLGRRYVDLLRSRADARLAGKKDEALPKLPTAEDVNDAQRKRIVDKILACKGEDEVRSVLSPLSLSEHYALAEIANDNEKLNEKFVPVAHCVNTPDAGLANEDDMKKLQAMKGKRLGKDMIGEILSMAKRLVAEGKVVNCVVTRQRYAQGVEVRARELSPGSDGFRKWENARLPNAGSANMGLVGICGGDTPRQAHVNASLSAGELSAGAVWMIPEPPPKTKTGEDKSASVAGKPPADKAPVEKVTVEKATEEQPAGDKVALEKPAAGKDKKAEAGDDALPPDSDEADEIDEGESSPRETEEEFWKAVAAFCEGKGDVFGTASITVYGMPSIKTDKIADGRQPSMRIRRARKVEELEE